MTEMLMTVKELAKYLNLNEKKIYALIKRGDIPCTKVTGKWLFPKQLIDYWIEDAVRGETAPESFESVTIVGSHDPAVDLLASEIHEIFPELTVLSGHVGSLQGLMTLRSGKTHITGIHLLDPDTNEYNLSYVHRYAASLKPIVVHFLDREQGLIVQAGNPLTIRGIEDLTRPGVRFVNRQEGAGTRLLFDFHLKQLGIERGRIAGYDDVVTTHTEVALAVRSGRANVGLGVRAAAAGSGLGFVPVTQERFDFIIPKRYFYTEPIQKCIEVVRSKHFKEKVDEMSGYDTTDAGTVLSWR
jgi:putative molybdopterin biosynthesis protein